MGRVFRAGLRAEALASDLRLNPSSATVGRGHRDGLRLEPDLHGHRRGHCQMRAKGSPLVVTSATGPSCRSE